MGLPVFYNIKDVNLTLLTNVPGFQSFNAIEGGLEEDSSIALEYEGDQVERKGDATGNNYQFSYKNNKGCTVTLALQHGGTLHKFIERAYNLAETTIKRKLVITGNMYDPVLKQNVSFVGAVAQRPNVTFANTLQSVSVEIIAYVANIQADTL